MKWLIWKEYRLNRLILIVGLVLLFGPHAIAAFLDWRGIGPANREGLSLLTINHINAAGTGVIISQLMLAFLGGHAIASERADRSAEFLAYLPVSRARILAAKIILPLLCAALIWIPNLLLLPLVLAWSPIDYYQVHHDVLAVVAVTALTGLVFFSVGWLLSSILESPTLSICGALVAPVLIILVHLPLESIGITYRVEHWRQLYLIACLALAPTCLIAGTWHYLRRVEP